MGYSIVYRLITFMDVKLVHHYGWEINTSSATILNTKPIATKNTAYASLERHVLKFFRHKMQRSQVKARIVNI